MELYKVERASRIKLLEDDTTIPPAHRPLLKGEILIYMHTDGMYSLCYDEEGEMVHPASWAEVEIVENETDPAIDHSVEMAERAAGWVQIPKLRG